MKKRPLPLARLHGTSCIVLGQPPLGREVLGLRVLVPRPFSPHLLADEHPRRGVQSRFANLPERVVASLSPKASSSVMPFSLVME
jgi:hypothetical protein